MLRLKRITLGERGTPYGDEDWEIITVKKIKLESTIEPRGKPKWYL